MYAAKVAEVLRAAGHYVVLMCQDRHPERFEFVDSAGTVEDGVVSGLDPSDRPRDATGSTGRLVLVRPEVGPILPVFVIDEYEGFEVKRFVDLSDGELATYLARNVKALRAVARWHRPEIVITGHAVPGAAVARRALGPGRYVAKIHGSDLEYAVRLQGRYAALAAEGLRDASAVVGPTHDVLARTVELVPEAGGRTLIVPPGVDVDRFRPGSREEGLRTAAELLEAVAEETARGRRGDADEALVAALGARDEANLGPLAGRYDQAVPDAGAAAELRALIGYRGPLVGYLGKLIPQKGVHLLLQALALAGEDIRAVIIGFGGGREWLHALVSALDQGDTAAARWIGERSGMAIELTDPQIRAARGLAGRVTFTGRLDHRFAPSVLAAMDVLVVPSILEEAFGMVAAEGASAGALPLVARHSGLAEVAAALEGAVGRPGVFSFEPGPGSPARIADGLQRLLELANEGGKAVRTDVSAFVRRQWTWEQTANRLLEAAR